jgi:serine/threonine-protein kinase
VVDQDPNAGEEAEEGSTVTLEVSNGPGTVRVPAVENLPQEQAIDELQDAELKVNLDRENSDDVRKDFAIRTVPREGVAVDRGTRVRLFVSAGPEQVTVPEVMGLSLASAEAQLRDQGFGVAVQEQESDEPEGDVIAQDPAGGTRVDSGATVSVTVSTGRPQIEVPDVIGLRAGEAGGRIRGAGLVPARREQPVTDASQDGLVIEQRPGAGVELEAGREVVIVVGVFPGEETLEPVEPPPP